MEIYITLMPSAGESAVALGTFDGLHVGHRKVISLSLDGAERGLIPTVFTFAENPLADLGAAPGGRIISQEEKIRLLRELGIGQLYILPFRTVRDFSAEEFVDRVLIGTLAAKKVCCGFNFTFGRGGKADSGTLRALCAQRGVEVAVADAVMLEGTPVSSSRIRGLIENGRVGEAARLLGRPFGYRSPVLRGRRLGHTLGTPTLNQALPQGFVRPRFGVYASAVHLGERTYFGVTNVGVKPTVGAREALAETWMPDYRGGELYGRIVRVDLLHFLRPERKFSGLQELRQEILRNGAQAREFFRRNPLPRG